MYNVVDILWYEHKLHQNLVLGMVTEVIINQSPWIKLANVI